MHYGFILSVQVHTLKQQSTIQCQCWTTWARASKGPNMTTDICLKYQLLNVCCVATATCYLQCIMHQIHLHSNFHGEIRLQTHACCPTCTRNADCPVSGIFKSAQERPNSVPINFNGKQDQYLVLLRVLCILPAVQVPGFNLPFPYSHSKNCHHRAMVCRITSFVTYSTR